MQSHCLSVRLSACVFVGVLLLLLWCAATPPPLHKLAPASVSLFHLTTRCYIQHVLIPWWSASLCLTLGPTVLTRSQYPHAHISINYRHQAPGACKMHPKHLFFTILTKTRLCKVRRGALTRWFITITAKWLLFYSCQLSENTRLVGNGCYKHKNFNNKKTLYKQQSGNETLDANLWTLRH